jgi:hypothetical protein
MGHPEDATHEDFTKASGTILPFQISLSAKLNFMDKVLPKLQASGSRVLIYSQWTQTVWLYNRTINT